MICSTCLIGKVPSFYTLKEGASLRSADCIFSSALLQSPTAHILSMYLPRPSAELFKANIMRFWKCKWSVTILCEPTAWSSTMLRRPACLDHYLNCDQTTLGKDNDGSSIRASTENRIPSFSHISMLSLPTSFCEFIEPPYTRNQRLESPVWHNPGSITRGRFLSLSPLPQVCLHRLLSLGRPLRNRLHNIGISHYLRCNIPAA